MKEDKVAEIEAIVNRVMDERDAQVGHAVATVITLGVAGMIGYKIATWRVARKAHKARKDAK